MWSAATALGGELRRILCAVGRGSGDVACLRPDICTDVWSNVEAVITLGIILLIVGLLIHSSILLTIGIILAVLGAILALLGAAGRAVFGRRHYW